MIFTVYFVPHKNTEPKELSIFIYTAPHQTFTFNFCSTICMLDYIEFRTILELAYIFGLKLTKKRDTNIKLIEGQYYMLNGGRVVIRQTRGLERYLLPRI